MPISKVITNNYTAFASISECHQDYYIYKQVRMYLTCSVSWAFVSLLYLISFALFKMFVLYNGTLLTKTKLVLLIWFVFNGKRLKLAFILHREVT